LLWRSRRRHGRGFEEDSAPATPPHYDIRTIQELLGHKDVPTTMIHTHGLNKGGRGVQSPADRLGPESFREPEP